MSDVPVQVFIPFVVLPLVGFMYWRGLKMRAQHLKENPQYGVGALAQRWQLQLTEGDPNYNLFINDRDAEVARHVPPIMGMKGHSPAHTAVMQGTHRGHPVRFDFFDQTTIERGPLTTTYARAYNCALSVAVQGGFPPFEIVLRNENEYFRVERKLGAPAQQFGQHAIDSTLVLTSADARVGSVLAQAVSPLLAMQYVHVLGGNGQVSFLMAPMPTSSALYHAESVLQVLLAVADVLEGKPVGVGPAPSSGPVMQGPSMAATPGATGGVSPANTAMIMAGETQSPVPCARCGAAMTPAHQGPQYGDAVPMQCAFCGAQEMLSNESRVRVAHERISALRAAQDAAEAPARGVDQLIKMRPWLGGIVLGAVMLLNGLNGVITTARSITGIATIDDAEKLKLLGQACVVPAAGIGVAVGMLIGWRIALKQYRAAVEPEQWARPPMQPGGAARCRCCGGTLSAQWGAFVTCEFCRTPNLMSHAVMEKREVLLREETSVHQQRAAGVFARANKSHANFGRFSMIGAGVGAAVFALVGFGAAALLVYL